MVNHLPETFSALGDPTRFLVVDLLRKQDFSASELAAHCSMSAPAMSRHLRVLRKRGLVEVVQTQRTESDARLRVYRLRPEPFLSVKEWADSMQAFWNSQLASFKAYAEGKHSKHRKRMKGFRNDTT